MKTVFYDPFHYKMYLSSQADKPYPRISINKFKMSLLNTSKWEDKSNPSNLAPAQLKNSSVLNPKVKMKNYLPWLVTIGS